uniref:C1orf43 homolog n=1 Tax=Caligus rogercresseyi TaxID=217165 RepID=C1BRP5_CALRO|nr:C1orf43 homolog [Caligus rogercresseyi]|eukprot:TRINITY_DN758_c0_g1_i1.p1 TRINITY_DN758_c0_g1~~TRINITY_DN758_c0_g1_i1.p1  ORF type:complete len:232 (+),score=50.77 TRINITY_DN758_c0_g1_i1:695-1390(+)
MPVEQLSGVTVVIIIAVCVEAFIVLLIFARRQIMRFSLRNRRGPHTHIGLGAPKALRREVDRKLDYIPYVKYEPPPQTRSPVQLYRIKALEDYRSFEKDLFKHYPSFARIAGSNIRSFLNSCLSGPLSRVNSKLIHQICDDYSDARLHYGEFGEARYKIYASRLEALRREVFRGPSPSSAKSHHRHQEHHMTTNRLSLEIPGQEESVPLKRMGSSTVLVMGNEAYSGSTAV